MADKIHLLVVLYQYTAWLQFNLHEHCYLSRAGSIPEWDHRGALGMGLALSSLQQTRAAPAGLQTEHQSIRPSARPSFQNDTKMLKIWGRVRPPTQRGLSTFYWLRTMASDLEILRTPPFLAYSLVGLSMLLASNLPLSSIAYIYGDYNRCLTEISYQFMSS